MGRSSRRRCASGSSARRRTAVRLPDRQRLLHGMGGATVRGRALGPRDGRSRSGRRTCSVPRASPHAASPTARSTTPIRRCWSTCPAATTWRKPRPKASRRSAIPRSPTRPAVRNGNAFAVDATSFFSRPGPTHRRRARDPGVGGASGGVPRAAARLDHPPVADRQGSLHAARRCTRQRRSGFHAGGRRTSFERAIGRTTGGGGAPSHAECSRRASGPTEERSPLPTGRCSPRSGRSGDRRSCSSRSGSTRSNRG